MAEFPKPEDFGLTQKEIKHFNREPKERPVVDFVLGLVCVIAGIALFGDPIRTFLFLFLFLMFGGRLLAELVGRPLVKSMIKFGKRLHPKYPDYVFYRSAWSRHLEEEIQGRDNYSVLGCPACGKGIPYTAEGLLKCGCGAEMEQMDGVLAPTLELTPEQFGRLQAASRWESGECFDCGERFSLRNEADSHASGLGHKVVHRYVPRPAS
jgi:hypothetical protein